MRCFFNTTATTTTTVAISQIPKRYQISNTTSRRYIAHKERLLSYIHVMISRNPTTTTNNDVDQEERTGLLRERASDGSLSKLIDAASHKRECCRAGTTSSTTTTTMTMTIAMTTTNEMATLGTEELIRVARDGSMDAKRRSRLMGLKAERVVLVVNNNNHHHYYYYGVSSSNTTTQCCPRSQPTVKSATDQSTTTTTKSVARQTDGDE
jgi:hypothetical protein